jgi:hypothetical protein
MNHVVRFDTGSNAAKRGVERSRWSDGAETAAERSRQPGGGKQRKVV